ncbi:putative serine protease K12H4.7 isoform X1 [Rhodnius prolixus]|uniref:putative serine protease K12H4.7 isoform X1 n=2 Tax=Rhodnius prolixus TaxID=13249 RepID=UPI003D18E608
MQIMKFLLLVYFLWMNSVEASLKINRLYLSAPQVNEGVQLPPDQWFEQKLDHFDPTNKKTWLQRYGVNDSFAKVVREAPVFLMIGGEGEANPKWLVKGAWIDYAQKFGALCFQLEHRYYGKSRPTADVSVENLRYLSSEQALADLAYFIKGMNKKYNLDENNKWIAFGGSYPGSLAAWLRYKYPHLVHAAISTSGPLLAIADFKKYNEVVKKSLGTFSEDCVASVKSATKHFDKLVQHPIGGKLISKKFELCQPLNVSKKEDISSLASSLADNFAGIVQYNKDNRISADPTAKITIDDLCKIMIDRSLGEPLDRYAAVNSMMRKVQSEKCLDYIYSASIQELSNITWPESFAAADRQWFYQTCTEFGFYQTSSSDAELFGSNFPLDFFIKQCKDAFGERFNGELLDLGIQRTNTIYGDFHLSVSRVLFVHGSIDPWHALGITSSKNPEAPAIYILGTAHCANMYPQSPQDPPQLVKARLRIYDHIGKWLLRN